MGVILKHEDFTKGRRNYKGIFINVFYNDNKELVLRTLLNNHLFDLILPTKNNRKENLRKEVHLNLYFDLNELNLGCGKNTFECSDGHIITTYALGLGPFNIILRAD